MPTEPDAVKPWHRQPGESDKSFAYFQLFLAMEPTERTTPNLAKACGVSESAIDKHRGPWKWNERVAAYDQFLSAEADKVAARAAQNLAFDWGDWELQNHERVRGIAEKLFRKCEQMLNLPVQQMKQETDPVIDPATGEPMTDARGRPIYQTVTIVEPVRFSAGDVPRYAEAAIILSRYLAETYGPQPVYSPLPPPSKPVEDMTVEEREQYIEQIRAKQREITEGRDTPIETNGGVS